MEQLRQWGEAVAEFGGTAGQWLRYNAFMYRRLSFEGKSVIDIGGGIGRASYYAACAGARRVVCVEPQAGGSRDDMIQASRRLGARLGLSNVEFIASPIESVELSEVFDLVLLHNSINHFDEEACSRLHFDPSARAKYNAFLRRVAGLCGEKIVITDCSRRNLFGDIGLRNPFAPTINWRIHQPPELWQQMLATFGFGDADIRWTPDRRTGPIGEMLLSNRIAAYCLQSHFCLTMSKRATR